MNDFAGTDIAPSGTVFLVLAVVTLVVAPVVLLMKRSVAEKGAHIGAELGAPAAIACADEVSERCRLMAHRVICCTAIWLLSERSGHHVILLGSQNVYERISR